MRLCLSHVSNPCWLDYHTYQCLHTCLDYINDKFRIFGRILWEIVVLKWIDIDIYLEDDFSIFVPLFIMLLIWSIFEFCIYKDFECVECLVNFLAGITNFLFLFLSANLLYHAYMFNFVCFSIIFLHRKLKRTKIFFF